MAFYTRKINSNPFDNCNKYPLIDAEKADVINIQTRHVPVSVTTVTLTITADDQVYVYHGGELVLVDINYRVAQSVVLDEPCVLAVYAVNLRGVAAILASTSTGVVTDVSWKCSDVEQTGWHLAGFNDSAWSQARIIAPNDGSFWPGVIAGINSEAKWIWAQTTSATVAYCRKTLC